MRFRSPVVTLLLSLGSVFVFVLVLHGYQYFRMQANLAPILIQEAGERNLEAVNRFFTQVTSTLTMIRDWGRNGTLDRDDPVSLNKKFFPLLDSQEVIRSLILADEQGNEYYLYRQDPYRVTRSRRKGGDTLTWRQWQRPDQVVKTWEKKSPYDPQERPWFRQALAGKSISWTPVYTFYQSGEKGLTASVAWEETQKVVCGLDIPVRQIRDLLGNRQQDRPYTLFLASQDGKTIIGADQEGGTTALVEAAVAHWQQQANPVGKTLTFRRNNVSWQAVFKPLDQKTLPFCLGVAAPVSDIGTSLARGLLDFSYRELLLALAGGLGLFVLLRWIGRSRGTAPELSSRQLLDTTIAGGESSTTEFKSTIRTNLKTGKQGKEIELAWLKAVVAFLNSRGGTLLLGVADDGTILGLDQDGFDSDDRCLLHIKNLLNQHLGAEFFRFIRITLMETPEGKVAMIRCTPAGKPVFLRIGKNEEFYIRSGPASTKLSPSQIVSYIQKRE